MAGGLTAYRMSETLLFMDGALQQNLCLALLLITAHHCAHSYCSIICITLLVLELPS